MKEDHEEEAVEMGTEEEEEAEENEDNDDW